ncbi:MAG: NAD(P)-dependent oxidoreductase [Anaerolineae bacterium]|nr:NAD(P)-dependent oxidoreductase [Anaerolineae bacterium]
MHKIVVTGGSGRAGRAIIRELVEHGYEVLNVDVAPSPDPLTPFRKVDLRDYGQTFVALNGADAVVHMAANPGVDADLQNGAAIFHLNTSTAYNVFNAATALGLQKVVWASSVMTVANTEYGIRPARFPVDETHPTCPGSNYALSKVVGEQMAREFSRWSGIPFVSLRFSWITLDTDYASFPAFSDNIARYSVDYWSYVDHRDVGLACRLALEADTSGMEIINIAAADTRMKQPNHELVETVFPGAPMNENLGDFEALFSIEKARRLLGYEPRFSWREPPG